MPFIPAAFSFPVQQEMKHRFDPVISQVGIGGVIAACVELGRRAAEFPAAELDEVTKRVDIQRGNIGVSFHIPFGIEDA